MLHSDAELQWRVALKLIRLGGSAHIPIPRDNSSNAVTAGDRHRGSAGRWEIGPARHITFVGLNPKSFSVSTSYFPVLTIVACMMSATLRSYAWLFFALRVGVAWAQFIAGTQDTGLSSLLCNKTFADANAVSRDYIRDGIAVLADNLRLASSLSIRVLCRAIRKGSQTM